MGVVPTRRWVLKQPLFPCITHASGAVGQCEGHPCCLVVRKHRVLLEQVFERFYPRLGVLRSRELIQVRGRHGWRISNGAARGFDTLLQTSDLLTLGIHLSHKVGILLIQCLVGIHQPS